ncbi:Calcium-binding mitochondrial carrier protein Aralar1-like Protein [Tribolium castaneum]|uniref:Calcium-binding mitochondrial carrier protein Aralar1-like Protein n=1 Tax=Tribolium castaneum TaxID=7070 RepID=A0A139WM29_TRICA|nr:PREDICTED: solute carrier family 25 member 40 isoform X1 [Tribolium castaneum]KYB29088.1 Calcium-binding mitochondrial carrier protein Aralar1-like Protein [Tribolium castaneum]|eukprot:XP_015840812.1 PREDICTED: solute carrier family 25 member 40 isoform X1 [Tribolium castaneum]
MSLEDPLYHITPVQQAAASCTGAVLTSLLVTPLDVVKIRLQAQHRLSQNVSNKCFLYCNGLMDHFCGCTPNNGQKHWFQRPGHFNGTIDAFIKITKNEGIYSLWSGLGPTLVLALPTTILYFVTYEQLRLRLKNLYNRNNVEGQERKQPYWIPLISGATARIFAVSVVSPLELIRTKMQSRKISYAEINESLKLLIKQDGIKGLWKGVFPTLGRDVPFSAIYWMNYETIKGFFGSDTPTFGVSFFAGAVSGGIAAFATVPFDVVKTHQQIEIGEKTLYTDKPQRTKRTAQIIREIYRHSGIKGLYAGLVPRLVKVAPACAIMISSFEYGKVFFYRLANPDSDIFNSSKENLQSNK